MKKFFAMLAVAVLVCAAVVGAVNLPEAFAEEAQLKDIDVYLIAGQSNGVGYTAVDSESEQAEIAKDERYRNGFDDVKYYGYVECNKDTTLPANIALRSVKLGKGADSQGKTRETKYETFGPELGMAKYFADNGIANTNYGIIKYAAGGTAIYDEFTSNMGSQYGNWMSPSLVAKYGKGSATLTGLCYANFLTTVRQGLKAYKDNGYNPVIKGLAWMQGESESQSANNSKRYAELLSTMIADMRKDLTEISGQNLSELLTVVAKIPSKYKDVVSSAAYVDVVRAQMDAVAENDADVITIDNDFVTLPGTDNHHYNVPDMLQVGHNFAEAFIEATNGSLPKVKVVCTEGGASDVVSKRAIVDTALAVTLTPDKGYELVSYSFVGDDGHTVEVTSRKVGNVVRFVMPSGNVTLKVVFQPIPKYNVTVDGGEHGEIFRTNAQRQPFKGETVTFTFKPEDGYKLDKVTVNGTEVKTDGTYTYPTYTTEVTQDISVVATYVKIVADVDPKPDRPDSNGCNGVVATAGAAIAAFATVAVAYFVRKKNI
uniref:sialate O-acetylesterase n=1 Tax=Candidatus Fimenecus sp. TaxID=3022888 RepID=UPI0040272F80